MANRSDTSIELHGNIFSVSAFKQEFDRNSDNWMCVDDLVLNETSIQIYGDGRWSSDVQAIAELAVKYKLHGTLVDSEPGSDFFTKVEVTDGDIYTTHTDYFSEESVEEFGIDYFIETYFDYITDDIDNEYSQELLDKFESYGTPKSTFLGENNV